MYNVNSDKKMISKEEEQYILNRAYVPEHIVSLMILVSKAEPSLIDNHLVYSKEDWSILVGYPLDGDFQAERLRSLAYGMRTNRSLRYLWVIAPEMPDDLCGTPSARTDDYYYRLDLSGFHMKGSARRAVKKAQPHLSVQQSETVTKEHEALIAEFIKRERPNAMIGELFLGMAEYVNRSDTAFVLEARDLAGRLSAFFVIDTAACTFDTYVVGCHSRKHSVPYASDLLFANMIMLAQQHGKDFINLGLGVTSGIRRFKEKWGGVPFLRYEFCEFTFGQQGPLSIIDAIRSRL